MHSCEYATCMYCKSIRVPENEKLIESLTHTTHVCTYNQHTCTHAYSHGSSRSNVAWASTNTKKPRTCIRIASSWSHFFASFVSIPIASLWYQSEHIHVFMYMMHTYLCEYKHVNPCSRTCILFEYRFSCLCDQFPKLQEAEACIQIRHALATHAVY
jgi:hypothetical protein